MGIKSERQWPETVGNGERLLWKPRSTTDRSAWGEVGPINYFVFTASLIVNSIKQARRREDIPLPHAEYHVPILDQNIKPVGRLFWTYSCTIWALVFVAWCPGDCKLRLSRTKGVRLSASEPSAPEFVFRINGTSTNRLFKRRNGANCRLERSIYRAGRRYYKISRLLFMPNMVRISADYHTCSLLIFPIIPSATREIMALQSWPFNDVRKHSYKFIVYV
jgi:hypothetical protein